MQHNKYFGLNMINIFNIFDRMLHFNPRIKNVICTIIALIIAAIFLPYIATTSWYTSIVNIHASMWCVIAIGFLILFWLAVWMVYTFIAWIVDCIKRSRREDERQSRHNEHIRDQLSTLSDWQMRFLIGMVLSNKHQIKYYEIGQWSATWEDDLRVLINKRIMKQYDMTSTYEIMPDYFQYIKDNYDTKTGTLN